MGINACRIKSFRIKRSGTGVLASRKTSKSYPRLVFFNLCHPRLVQPLLAIYKLFLAHNFCHRFFVDIIQVDSMPFYILFLQSPLRPSQEVDCLPWLGKISGFESGTAELKAFHCRVRLPSALLVSAISCWAHPCHINSHI
jgi:hypothetical protein